MRPGSSVITVTGCELDKRGAIPEGARLSLHQPRVNSGSVGGKGGGG